MAEIEQTNLTALTVDLLSAYFANNTVDSAQLSGLIRSTHDALKGIDAPAPEVPAEPEFKAMTTARKSLLSPDHIVSMIDGKPYKTLKRHLGTHGLTPAEYRERYKLPRDYPMVAPGYSQARREVAERLGLGRKPAPVTSAAPETPAEPPAPAEAAPKTQAKTAPKPKTIAKAPTKSAKAATAPAAKKKAPPKPKIAPAPTDTPPDAAPVVETPTSAPATAPVKKASPRKAKAPPVAAAEATTKPAAKRGPKPKAPAVTPDEPTAE